MILEQSLSFYSTLAQVSATFAGVFIAVIAWLIEKGKKNELKTLFRGLAVSAVMLSACALNSVLTILYVGTAYEAQYGWVSFILAGLAVFTIFSAIVLSPGKLKM